MLRVALDASDEGVRERVRFCAVVLGLDDYDFLAGVAASADDGYAPDFEDCEG